MGKAGSRNPHTAAVLSYDLRFRLSDVHLDDRMACNTFFVWEMLRLPLLEYMTKQTDEIGLV